MDYIPLNLEWTCVKLSLNELANKRGTSPFYRYIYPWAPAISHVAWLYDKAFYRPFQLVIRVTSKENLSLTSIEF